jgi:hypothetical protein
MQRRARQRVEQRHQQKHDVERQGGDGAAQHEGMRIILKCGGDLVRGTAAQKCRRPGFALSQAIVCSVGVAGFHRTLIPECLNSAAAGNLGRKPLLGGISVQNIPQNPIYSAGSSV